MNIMNGRLRKNGGISKAGPRSCDTMVIFLKDENGRKTTIFAKNSDRPDDEAQLITYIPAKNYPEGRMLQTTYLKIPQVQHTNAVILSKPYWMWGAEMGVNEHGVAIGNEAVWTIRKLRHKGLTGMDLVRLGLERGSTAKEALDVIIKLLGKYHQGGFCDVDGSMLYHNSFLIADPDEAWILETADDWWVAEKITEGFRNISNELSILGLGHYSTPGIVEWCQKHGYCTGKDDFSFAKIFSGGDWNESLLEYGRYAGIREQLSQLEKDWKNGIITSKTEAILRVMEILRDHDSGACMHGDFISAGSQISVLDREFPQHWFTITPFPCKSLYIPFTFSIKCKGLKNKEIYYQVESHWDWARAIDLQMHLHEGIHGDIHNAQREIVSEYNEHLEKIKNGSLTGTTLKEFTLQFNERVYTRQNEIFNVKKT